MHDARKYRDPVRGAQRLGLRPEPSARAHAGEVQHQPAVSVAAVRGGEGAVIAGRTGRAGEYKGGTNYYVGTNNCADPLFAASLPSGATLTGNVRRCHPADLPGRTRTSDLIFYAIIGGVADKLSRILIRTARKIAS